jgi:hypothetical protein
MTDAQLAVVAQFRSDLNELLNRCIAARDAAKAAEAKLPHTNERGTPVLFGANKCMYRILDSYQTMIDELAAYLPTREPELSKPRGF